MGFLVHLLNRINDLPIIFFMSILPLTAFFFASQYFRKNNQKHIWQHVAIATAICLIGHIGFHILTHKKEVMLCSPPSHAGTCHSISMPPWYKFNMFPILLTTANVALCAYLFLYILSPRYPASKLSTVLNKLKMMVKAIVELIKAPIVFLLQSVAIVTFFSVGTVFLFGGATEFGYNQSDFFPVTFAAICQISFILLFFYFPISLYIWKRHSRKTHIHIALFITILLAALIAQFLAHKLHYCRNHSCHNPYNWRNYLPTVTMSFFSVLLYLYLLRRSERKKA